MPRGKSSNYTSRSPTSIRQSRDHIDLGILLSSTARSLQSQSEVFAATQDACNAKDPSLADQSDKKWCDLLDALNGFVICQSLVNYKVKQSMKSLHVDNYQSWRLLQNKTHTLLVQIAQLVESLNQYSPDLQIGSAVSTSSPYGQCLYHIDLLF
jgi:hypothetical protein